VGANQYELEASVRQMKEAANQGCGLVYELYTERFSAMLDAKFPPGHPQRDAVIALSEDDYFTPDEIARGRQEADEMGLCSHGLDPDCCPCGCGDLEF
jgi:hypothetical protein